MTPFPWKIFIKSMHRGERSSFLRTMKESLAPLHERSDQTVKNVTQQSEDTAYKTGYSFPLITPHASDL